jgi:hypothetical protein
VCTAICDYSLTHLASRPAVVGDELTTKNFGYSTGFCGTDPNVAVCVRPGTELAFSDPIKIKMRFGTADAETLSFTTAIFRQRDKEYKHTHHDMLEMPDGQMFYLNDLEPDQRASVLQLPAEPVNEAERDEQTRAEFV